MLMFQSVPFELPPHAGKVVGMCQYRDRVLIACEYGLFEVIDDGLGGYTHREMLMARIEELEKRS